MIRIQHEPFDIGALYKGLSEGSHNTGAVVSFVGRVRDFNESPEVTALSLEHYPGMTERALENVVERAQGRWEINDAIIVHRIGYMTPGDDIVAVLVSTAHRHAAFEACAFIMDFLKTSAPFWKKEHTQSGAYWVSERESDLASLKRWEQQ
ncbi:molybdopterin synthase subunit MoaE [Kushneria indalinina DSM 14324]|uniref:Molybdopterin synthase catalytic subunit n=2 Tax=Kushneria indalinina TaxID=184067 RepID=A0A3D9E022_9GAMM|nr:molybdopterin synthase catalytic subunit MoaE [Kushneria indalinina]REC96386.1 molybdopterin synthase subunit MoaE [Kushneria indalinina DSM 14324]